MASESSIVQGSGFRLKSQAGSNKILPRNDGAESHTSSCRDNLQKPVAPRPLDHLVRCCNPR